MLGFISCVPLSQGQATNRTIKLPLGFIERFPGRILRRKWVKSGLHMRKRQEARNHSTLWDLASGTISLYLRLRIILWARCQTYKGGEEADVGQLRQITPFSISFYPIVCLIPFSLERCILALPSLPAWLPAPLPHASAMPSVMRPSPVAPLRRPPWSSLRLLSG
ncbi:hypothetical protein MPH_03338 [Macrophomina phaseolina MS6]|uniref:Uncharacterized protein n=1 Tax=Macrophomina phaseolina (strain MS6) TaxID=1126212 RepID=K2SAQ4_MACPH|nr:hypothetical protein MPH_03338 [Macrophomina phaseolina MS6]